MIETFQPLIAAATGLDLTEPEKAKSELVKRFDPRGAAALALNAELVKLLEAGKIADRGEMPDKYGRVAKATDATSNFSIDVVLMNGPGPHHRHPQGEVNYCIALDGAPRFDGEPAGWVVMPPGSGHVPTVSQGKMLIVYLLPEGQIEFTR